jgi:hypothetical protein
MKTSAAYRMTKKIKKGVLVYLIKNTRMDRKMPVGTWQLFGY